MFIATLFVKGKKMGKVHIHMVEYYASMKKNVIKEEKQSAEQCAENGPICVNKKEYIS